MSSSDKLQIFIDNILTPASDETLQLVNEQTELMRRMVKLMEPSANQNSAGYQRVEVTSIVPAVLNQQYFSYFGNQTSTIITAESTFNLQSRIAYTALRNNLTFS